MQIAITTDPQGRVMIDRVEPDPFEAQIAHILKEMPEGESVTFTRHKGQFIIEGVDLSWFPQDIAEVTSAAKQL